MSVCALLNMSEFTKPKPVDNDEVDAESDIEDAEEPAPVVRVELHPSDFYFGATLGEGAYARVVHAKSKKTGEHFAVKIMEKMHIKKENKVCCWWILTTTLDFALTIKFSILTGQTSNEGKTNFSYVISSIRC